MENIKILPINEDLIESFHACLDSVAKERIHLARLEAPPLESTINFVKKKIDKEIIHFIALIENTVIGWCDIHPLTREGFTHCGVLGMGVLKNYRGRGVGKLLLKTALSKAEGLKKKVRKIDGEYYDILCMALLF